MEIPANMVSSEAISLSIKDVVCNNCFLSRRTESNSITNIVTGYIDVGALFSEKRMIDLSVNLFSCKQHREITTTKDDVLIVAAKQYDLDFINDSQLSDIDLSKVTHEKVVKEIIFFLKGEIESIRNSFITSPKTKNQSKVFQYYIDIVHKPKYFNPFHFEFHIYSNHSGDFEKITDDSPKAIIRAICHNLKSFIITNRLLFTEPRNNKRMLFN